MTLEEFDKQMALAAEKVKYGNSIVKEGGILEHVTLRRAGIEHTDREPGFPCWRVKGIEMKYCGSPREALEEANRIRGLDMTVTEAREKNLCRVCKNPMDGKRGETYRFGGEYAHTDCLPRESFANEFEDALRKSLQLPERETPPIPPKTC